MANIPTESRIFANRFLRDIRRLEALHAGKISPGATDWRDAMEAVYIRMGRAGKPDKQVAIIGKVADYLHDVAAEDRIHLTVAKTARKRSAILCMATFSAGLHPLKASPRKAFPSPRIFSGANATAMRSCSAAPIWPTSQSMRSQDSTNAATAVATSTRARRVHLCRCARPSSAAQR
jgi:hypothetical protein